MQRMDAMYALLAMVMLFLLLAGLTATTPAAAQTSERCFAETGHCISGPIRTYWEANGGLPVFGYPISEQRVETVILHLGLQWLAFAILLPGMFGG